MRIGFGGEVGMNHPRTMAGPPKVYFEAPRTPTKTMASRSSRVLRSTTGNFEAA